MNENVTLPQLSSIQHKDWKGEVINDPDRSNPARSRMERPLDTIRSFEAAIDNNHKRKALARSGMFSLSLLSATLTDFQAESVDLSAMSSRRESFVGGGKSCNQFAMVSLLLFICSRMR